MEYHPSKKYIRASIELGEIKNIPDDIVLPFYIEYNSLYPFILYIFKRVDDELHFIEKDELDIIFETFFYQPVTFINHHTIFYEIQNVTELSGTLYDNSTVLWFATPYEIYNTKHVFNLPFSSQVNTFFLDNPLLQNLYWDHIIQPSPIIAYSQNQLKNIIFQSTFGTDFEKESPHYKLYKNIINPLLHTTRFSLFTPFEESNTNGEISFENHIQHTPICYTKNVIF